MASPNLRVLLVGKGGREHALAWRLAKSKTVSHVYVVPGNGGTLTTQSNISNVDSIRENDYPSILIFAKEHEIGLVVVGPDSAVIDGIEAHFRGSGIPCFAPTKEAAEVEGSKTYAKDFMAKYCIPTAAYQSFSDYDAAKNYLEHHKDDKIVIKVDGLAAGKGVVLPNSHSEAEQALRDIMVDGIFGPAGNSVVIEEFLEGDEISILTFSDGKTSASFPCGQDHKRIFEGNEGPNTGGMGVFAPVPFVNPEQMRSIEDTILRPTFRGLEEEGRQFIGLLFTGIMMTRTAPKVLEYNARFGDPETQTMMMLLSPECDLADILLSCCAGTLDKQPISMLPGFACNIVVASGGYPGPYPSGKTIKFGACPPGVQVFHAGTKVIDGVLKTNGGRVFSVAAYGPTLQEAVSLAYQGVESIHFENMFYRKDIARRFIESTRL